VTGKKAELAARLLEALKQSGDDTTTTITTTGTADSSSTTASSSTTTITTLEDVKPGTSHLGEMASAAEAAKEKIAAGESRAVEHVALHDEAEEEVIAIASPPTKSSGRRKRRTDDGSSSISTPVGKRKREDRSREWAAEVAVPGSEGLMTTILLEAEGLMEDNLIAVGEVTPSPKLSGKRKGRRQAESE